MFPRIRSEPLVLVLLCLCLGSRPARASDDFDHSLAEAIRLYESLDYEAALRQLELTRSLPHTPERDVQVSLYEGSILANLGRWEKARLAFRSALSRDPDATLPLLAPKVKKELEAVRTRVRKELAKAPRAEPRAPPPASAAEDRPERAVAPSLTPAVPQPAPLQVTQGVERPSRVPVLPLVLLGTGVVAGGLGGYFGWSARGQIASARAAPLQTEAALRLEEARGDSRVANVLLGGAGLAAVGALVSWWWTGGAHAESSSVSDTSGDMP